MGFRTYSSLPDRTYVGGAAIESHLLNCCLRHLVVRLINGSLDALVLLLLNCIKVLEELVAGFVSLLLVHSSILNFGIVRKISNRLVTVVEDD